MENEQEDVSLPNGYSLSQQLVNTPLYDLYAGTTKTNEQVWLKIFSFAKRKSKNAYQQEFSNLTKLKNQANGKTSNVIEIIDHFIVDRFGVIVLPVQEKNLRFVLENEEPDLKTKYKIFYELCCALDECFKAKVAHLDVQLANIIIFPGYSVKLGNFSSSLRWSTLKSSSMKNSGVEPFKAPEITSPCGFTPYLADYWSLGIVLHSLLSDKVPVIQESKKVMIDDSIPQTARNLVDSLVQVEPQLRPPIDFVLTHELFTQEEIFSNLRLNFRNTKKRKKKGITHRLQRVMSANLGKMKKGSSSETTTPKGKRKK